MKNIVFFLLIPVIGFTQAKDTSSMTIIKLDEEDVYYGKSDYLGNIYKNDTTLIWTTIDTKEGKEYENHYKDFYKIIQYETHFSNILDNYVLRQYASVKLPEESALPEGNRYHALVLEIQYYYTYQCDTFINVVNRYKVTTTGHPTEEGAPVLYDTWDRSVFIFFDHFNFGDVERDKLDIIRKRVMDLVKKY